MAKPKLDELFGDISGYRATINRMIHSIDEQQLTNQSSGDSSDYNEIINEKPISSPKRYPFLKLLSEDLQIKQAPAAETLTEDERGLPPSNSVLEDLKESRLSQMLDEAATLICKRPKKGKIYSILETNVSTIIKEIQMRKDYDEVLLEDLINKGTEIADAVSMLKISGKSTNEIELVGELAKTSAMVFQVTSILQNEGLVLLGKCISKLESIDFDE